MKDYAVRPDYNRPKSLPGRLSENKYIGIIKNLIVKKCHLIK